MIQKLLVLGSGSAGLMAAISFRRRLPDIYIRLVRSPEIGTIGVGEGTTPFFPEYLFGTLGISRKHFYASARPTWKLGIRYQWGPRDFNFSFSHQLDYKLDALSRLNGYYCDDEFSYVDLLSSLMAENKAFPRQTTGGNGPEVQHHAFHFENARLVETLEGVARANGVEFIDGKVSGAERGPDGITAIHLEDGQRLEADFFVDASGFRSELLGKALEEPFIPYKNSLFCDRAIVGGWERRPDEPILPYTTAETMDGGWAWQIEHETIVNRGYVFSSDHTSDEDAREEFLRKNPRANKDGRVVKFRSGRHRNLWVDNVAAVGNAAGFVEPLEATAIMMVCSQCTMLINSLLAHGTRHTPSLRATYNKYVADSWDEIRDFLAVHYCYNTRLDTPFWRRCIHETDVSNVADLIQFYRENGPSQFAKMHLPATANNFGLEGWLVMFVAQQVPHQGRYQPPLAERELWETYRRNNRTLARASMDVREALAYVHHPGWSWHADSAPPAATPAATMYSPRPA